jgi:hypothetical protein
MGGAVIWPLYVRDGEPDSATAHKVDGVSTRSACCCRILTADDATARGSAMANTSLGRRCWTVATVPG